MATGSITFGAHLTQLLSPLCTTLASVPHPALFALSPVATLHYLPLPPLTCCSAMPSSLPTLLARVPRPAFSLHHSDLAHAPHPYAGMHPGPMLQDPGPGGSAGGPPMGRTPLALPTPFTTASGPLTPPHARPVMPTNQSHSQMQPAGPYDAASIITAGSGPVAMPITRALVPSLPPISNLSRSLEGSGGGQQGSGQVSSLQSASSGEATGQWGT